MGATVDLRRAHLNEVDQSLAQRRLMEISLDGAKRLHPFRRNVIGIGTCRGHHTPPLAFAASGGMELMDQPTGPNSFILNGPSDAGPNQLRRIRGRLPQQRPLYRQIYEWTRAAIVAGRLRPGERLPSARSLAAQLGAARGTIDAAYAMLSGEGW